MNKKTLTVVRVARRSDVRKSLAWMLQPADWAEIDNGQQVVVKGDGPGKSLMSLDRIKALAGGRPLAPGMTIDVVIDHATGGYVAV